MKNTRVATVLVLLMIWGSSAFAQLYEAPKDVIPTLPRFCWPQYMAPLPVGFDEFIRGCGEYANHYCPGLVNIKVADREKDLGRKMYQLEQAKGNMEYTLHYTNDIPDCFLRPHAKANLQLINFKIEMLQNQMKARKRY